MAARKGKKKKSIRFEMTAWGLAGLLLVCFCIFLWMFLLGIWAGQTVLLPSAGEEEVAAVRSGATTGSVSRPVVEAGEIKKRPVGVNRREPATDGSSFFSLQVDSFAESEAAREAVLDWQARGHNAFVLAPADDQETFWRVFVGRFDSLAKANKQASQLEKEEEIKVYITLLPATSASLP